MAESTRSALAKLRAAGVEPDTSQLAALEPSVQAREEAFEPLWTAVLDRVRVSFTYRGGEKRTLEPWGMTASKGRWYVIGWDTDRQATRMFKLTRITDKPRRVSKLGAYQVPDDLDLRALARSLDAREPNRTALVAVRPGRGPTLRRRGRQAPAEVDDPGVRLPVGFEIFEVGFSDLRTLAEETARYGADAIVLDPPELRTRVLKMLSAVAATPQDERVSA
jgi:proteasome accessory factor B